MNLEDTLAATFVDHEALAPDADAVLVSIRRQLDRQTPRRLGAVAVAAAVAAIAVTVALVSGSAPGAGRTVVGARPSSAFEFDGYTAPGAVIPVDHRHAAESIVAPLLDGSGTFTLAAHSGHVVVLSWDASWCGPCGHSYLGTGAASSLADWVTIDVKDSRAVANTYARIHGSASTVVFDREGSTLTALGLPTSAVPVTVLVDQDQRIAGVYVGVVSKRALIESISRL